MKVEIFRSSESWAKQSDKARFFLNRLRSVPVATLPCADYASSVALAHHLSSIDEDRLVQTIHVYDGYVKITRNEKGSFGFAAIVFDHVKYKYKVTEGCSRP